MGEGFKRAWRGLMCRIGWHHTLNVIQSFGAGEHVGCPDCGREYGIHHGMQVVIPWDGEIAELYTSAGYDVKRATDDWRRWRHNRAALAQEQSHER